MKKLFSFLILLTAMSVNAQHSITLTSGDVLTGKITVIEKKYITIVDSIHKSNCPIELIASYDAGNGIVIVSEKMIKGAGAARVIPKPLNESPVPQYLNKSASNELGKASSLFTLGIVFTGAGVVTAVLGPQMISFPTLSNGDYEKYFKEVDAYHQTCRGLVFVGSGIILVGTILELSAITHFELAGIQLDAKINNNGLGISMNF